MITKNVKTNFPIQMLCIDDLVPEDHLLRKIENAIDWSFIYGLVEDKYSDSQGRPSIDPVTLIKIPIIQYLFGIKSMRQTIKEIEVNVAYRWFLGLDLTDPVPHFSTFGKNYKRRFDGTDIFEQIFSKILHECISHKLVDTSEIFVDATHVKACANNKKRIIEKVHEEALFYEDELKKEINEDRAAHGKKPLKEKKEKNVSGENVGSQESADGKADSDSNNDSDNKDKTDVKNDSTDQEESGSKQDSDSKQEGKKSDELKEIKKSTTDPESGWFHKGDHKEVFAYSIQTGCDKNGWILGYTVNKGNLHDSRTFKGLYDKLKGDFKISKIICDAGYKTPSIAKLLLDDGVKPVFPYKRPMTKDGFFKKYEYVYDEYYDCILCPANKVLEYTTTNRDGKKEYKSNGSECAKCPYLSQCTNSKEHIKVVQRHIWEDYLEQCEDIRHNTGMMALYDRRKETIERIFGTAKEHHGFRYTQMKGKAKMEMKVSLTFACLNLKKLAKMLNKTHKSGKKKSTFFENLLQFFGKFSMISRLSLKKTKAIFSC